MVFTTTVDRRKEASGSPVRACVHVRKRAWMRACMHECVRACVPE